MHSTTRRVLSRHSSCAAALLLLGLAGCTHSAGSGSASTTQNDHPATTSPPALPVTAPPVETRSLLAEIDQAKFGATAWVRTPFGTSSGLVLPAAHEVLAHLHVLLTPGKSITDTISVNLSSPSGHTRRNLRVHVIAQDPTHDLVLLKVEEASPAQAASLDAGAQRMRPRRPREVRPAPPETSSQSTKPKPQGDVETRIVYDGPQDAGGGDPQP